MGTLDLTARVNHPPLRHPPFEFVDLGLGKATQVVRIRLVLVFHLMYVVWLHWYPAGSSPSLAPQPWPPQFGCAGYDVIRGTSSGLGSCDRPLNATLKND
jgi:hypothetical protein